MNKSPLSFSWKYPRITVGILLLVSVFFGLGIGKLETRNSFAGELPADDPVQVHIEKVNAHFGERSVLLIGIEAEDVFTEEVAFKIIGITEALADVPFVMQDEILSLSTIQNISNREWGLETSLFLEEIPGDEIAWQQLRKDVQGNAILLNRLISEDSQLIVIAATLQDGFEGGEVYEAVEKIIREFQGPEIIHAT